MSPLGLVKTDGAMLLPQLAAPALQVRIYDVLASDRRLWLRGRLLQPAHVVRPESLVPWWSSWRNRPEPPPLTIGLQTWVSGLTLKADVPLGATGWFEAAWTADLPPARRGWRIARSRVTLGSSTTEACAVVPGLPHGAREAVVVVLPGAYTLPANGAQLLAGSELAAQVSPLLHKLRLEGQAAYPVYYLACVPALGADRHAELALAAVTLGWPQGTFLPLPAEAGTVGKAIAAAVDRLRWVFSDRLSIRVLNLEPTAVPLLSEQLQPAAERASLGCLVHPEGDPWKLLDSPNGAPTVRGQGLPGPRPSRARLVTRFPLVFCHGLLANTMFRMEMTRDYNYFSVLGKFLRERGYRPLFPKVEPTGSVAERARQLREFIQRWTDEPVNVIAHSMGGLDARAMIVHPDMAGRVRSLTTIATPHRGSWLADWFLANYRERLPVLVAMEALGINVNGFSDCRPSACLEFNARTPDVPGVRYFSYAGDVPQARVSPLLRRNWGMLAPVEGPNDGLVSVQSARWSEYLGTVPADHFAQTPDGLFIHPCEKFDSLGFFLQLVEDLARRGF